MRSSTWRSENRASVSQRHARDARDLAYPRPVWMVDPGNDSCVIDYRADSWCVTAFSSELGQGQSRELLPHGFVELEGDACLGFV